MTKNTETLDRLFLEWSQFTNAETAKEIKLKKLIASLIEVLVDCEDYFDCDRDKFITNEEMRLLTAVREALHNVRSAE